MTNKRIELDPELLVAILTILGVAAARTWEDIKGKSREDIIAMADEEKIRSNSLQDRQESG